MRKRPIKISLRLNEQEHEHLKQQAIPVSWMQLYLLKGGEELSPLSKDGTSENFRGGTHTKK